MMLPILRVSDTVATIEVDVMPFLGRTSEGGPHAAAFRWLSRLGADFVRFAPWFPNPRVVVAELEPPDCSRNRTHWNTTLLDQIYADFASAVGSHSVAMQLSTLPSWLFADGLPLNRTPADPWQPDLDYGTTGGKLRDPTCGEAAQYVARLVGWYTAGGFMDECGAWHGSGYRYEWALLSVLNEVQHEHFYQGAGRPAAEAYTVCYDAIRRASLKVNPALRFAGPELGPVNWEAEGDTAFLRYFLDPANHADSTPPDYVSYHYPGDVPCPGRGTAAEEAPTVFEQFDCWLDGDAADADALRRRLAPRARLLANEMYPGGVPNDVKTADGGMNRTTTTFNLVAAWFGYAVGKLAEHGARVVGQARPPSPTFADPSPTCATTPTNTQRRVAPCSLSRPRPRHGLGPASGRPVARQQRVCLVPRLAHRRAQRQVLLDPDARRRARQRQQDALPAARRRRRGRGRRRRRAPRLLRAAVPAARRRAPPAAGREQAARAAGGAAARRLVRRGAGAGDRHRCRRRAAGLRAAAGSERDRGEARAGRVRAGDSALHLSSRLCVYTFWGGFQMVGLVFHQRRSLSVWYRLVTLHS
eukprot:Transcript_18968.p1 GENE.Transcript_18968~~Transcript_18968.p1  ORF type:complete len:605 (+),score=83.04 Transcript_18968:59-1816(+)